MEELIKQLNDLKITQTSRDWEEDLEEDLLDSLFGQYGFNIVEEDLEICKHRWYETSVKVYETTLGFIGVESVTDTFGDQQMVRDCYHTLEFFEMKQTVSTTYKRK